MERLEKMETKEKLFFSIFIACWLYLKNHNGCISCQCFLFCADPVRYLRILKIKLNKPLTPFELQGRKQEEEGF